MTDIYDSNTGKPTHNNFSGKTSNVLPTINGKVEVEYQVLKQYETAAQAFMALDPENAVAGVNIATMARDIFAIESQDNGYGVVSADRDRLLTFIQAVTGVNPITVKVYEEDKDGRRESVI